MTRGTWVAATVAALVLLAVSAASAQSASAFTIGSDGMTAPVFDYGAAVRQRVFIPIPGVDQDGNGLPDRVAVEIMRPPGSSALAPVPAVIDPSPYYTTVCRGRESECIADTDSRMGGIRLNAHYPASLSNTVTDAADQAACASSRASLSADDGDATGDLNAFWTARDSRLGAADVWSTHSDWPLPGAVDTPV